jgi:mannose-6-phosphate isomerase-like protein (cupin superfamily)
MEPPIVLRDKISMRALNNRKISQVVLDEKLAPSNMKSDAIHSSGSPNKFYSTQVSDSLGSQRLSKKGRNAESLFFGTKTSLLVGQNSPVTNWKPDIRVVSLAQDDTINFDGTFDSLRSPTRITLYRAQVTPEETLVPLLLELQRDLEITNKLFIVVQGEMQFERKEMHITIKQATNLLMKVQHDFRKFVSELICVKQGVLTLRNLYKQVFAPSQAQGLLLNQNSSYNLIKGTAKKPNASRSEIQVDNFGTFEVVQHGHKQQMALQETTDN